MAEFDDFDVMLDSATGEPVFDERTGELLLLAPTDNCCDPPVCGSVDVIHLLGTDPEPRRQRLSRSTTQTLWVTDPAAEFTLPGDQEYQSVWLQDEVEGHHQVALTHDGDGDNFDNGNYVVILDDNTGDGEVEGKPYEEYVYTNGAGENPLCDILYHAEFTHLSQEANGVAVGFYIEKYLNTCVAEHYLWPHLVSVSTGGSVDRFRLINAAPSVIGLTPWAGMFRGGARSGDTINAVMLASVDEFDQLFYDDDTSLPRLCRFWLEDDGRIGTSVRVLDGEMSTVDYAVYDESRELFYVVGQAAGTGTLTLFTVSTSGAVGTLAEWTDAHAAGQAGALTLLADGVYMIVTTSDGRQSAYRYSFGTSELVRLVDAGPGSGWPELTGSGTFGKAFIVGASDSCNDGCACEPTISLTRVFPLLEDEGAPDECLEDPFRPGCCTLSKQEVMQASCLHYFDYVITLCEDRTLAFVKIQGSRGAVTIDGIGPISSITDWSTLPLTGRMSFSIASNAACGPVESQLRITVIDSQDCCSTYIEDLSCCLCCPAGGTVTISGDEVEAAIVEQDGCGVLGDGIGSCGTYEFHPCAPGHINEYQWYQFEFGETTSSPCFGETPENRVCYIVDWDGMELRGGGSPPGLVQAGITVRIRWHSLTPASNPKCVRVWAYDALGDVECRTLVVEAAFVPACTFPPGTSLDDMGPCCLARGYNDTFTCGDQWPPA